MTPEGTDAGMEIAYEESPVFFDSPDGEVFGIVTRPVDGDGSTGCIVLPGGGTPLTTNRNRFSVRLCRELAAMGATALRMDYHGTGESSGTVEIFHLGRPFVHDATAAIDRLKGRGVERFVLIGSTCFGSRTAIAAAAECREVEEVIALALPLRDFAMGEGQSQSAALRKGMSSYVREAFRPRTVKRLFDARGRRSLTRHAKAKYQVTRDRAQRLVPGTSPSTNGATGVSPRLMASLTTLVDRSTDIVLVYGEEDAYYREFRDASDGALAPLLARAGSHLRVELVPGRAHGLTRVSVQDAVTRSILEHASRSLDGRAGDRPVASGETG